MTIHHIQKVGTSSRLDRMASEFVFILYRKFLYTHKYYKKYAEFACISDEA